MSGTNYIHRARNVVRRVISWRWFGVLNSAVVLALLYVMLARRLDGVDFKRILAGISPGWLLLAILGSMTTVVVTSFRTNDICRREAGRPLGLASIIRLQFVGVFMGFAMPISIAADVARVGMFRLRYNLPFETCTRAVVFDRIVGALGIIMAGILAFGLQPLLFEEPPFLATFQLAMLVGAAGFLVALVTLGRSDIKRSWRPLQIATSWMSILGAHLRDPDFVARQILYALAYVGNVCLTLLVLSWGLGFHVSFLLLIAFTPVILFVNNLPFLYAGWGGRELIAIVTLSQIGGMPANEALILSVGFGLSMLAAALLGAIFWIIRPTFRKTVKDDAVTNVSSVG